MSIEADDKEEEKTTNDILEQILIRLSAIAYLLADQQGEDYPQILEDIENED